MSLLQAFLMAKLMGGSGGGTGITDVQVNGTSVVQEGVANVPLGSTSVFGVFKVDGTNGISSTDGILRTAPASGIVIKNGGNTRTPITPNEQHSSVFYGFAKAAGADMKDIASTTVGTYPAAQKSAIQAMLGIDEWQLIKTVVLDEDASSIVIDTDEANQSFKLKDLFFTVDVKASESTTANTSAYIRIDPYNYIATLVGAVRASDTTLSGYIKPIATPSSSDYGGLAYFNIGLSSVNQYWNVKPIEQPMRNFSEYFSIYTTGTAKFGAGTTVQLFGVRK